MKARLVDLGVRLLLGAGTRRHVHLGADNRLHADLLRRLVELDCPEHVPVVGDCQGGHPELGRQLDHSLDARRAVEQAVLSVIMEVDEVHVRGLRGHGPIMRDRNALSRTENRPRKSKPVLTTKHTASPTEPTPDSPRTRAIPTHLSGTNDCRAGGLTWAESGWPCPDTYRNLL